MAPNLGLAFRLDDLEHVAIWVAEKEPCKGGRSFRFHDCRPPGNESMLQGIEFGPRKRHGDVPAKLGLELRRSKSFDFDQMKLLPRRNFQPGGRSADVARTVDGTPAQCVGEKVS